MDSNSSTKEPPNFSKYYYEAHPALIFLHGNPSEQLIRDMSQNIIPEIKKKILSYFLKEGDLEKFKIFSREFGLDDTENNSIFLKYTLDVCVDNTKCYEITKYLLESGVDVKTSDHILRTSLRYYYTWSGDSFKPIDLIKLFVEYGADIHCYDEYIFRLACEYFYYFGIEYIKFLVGLDVDINADNDYAIVIAAKNGHFQLCQYLVQLGANVNARDGWPLKYALQRYAGNQDSLLELFLSANADTKCISTYDILKCIGSNNLANIKILIKYGYDISIVNKMKTDHTDTDEMVNILKQHNINIENMLSLCFAYMSFE